MAYTQESIIKRFNEVHGEGKYDYTNVVFTGVRDKVEITCHTHTYTWMMTPTDHSSGRGCKHCGYARMTERSRETIESFVERARAVHGDKFDYSISKYVNARTPMDMRCRKHDFVFSSQPHVHLKSKFCCPRCESENKSTKFVTKTTEEYLKELGDKYGDRYSYERFAYEGIRVKSTVTCRVHGDFSITPASHSRGKGGCKQCGIDSKNLAQRSTLEDFIRKAEAVHGVGTYCYSDTKYKNGSSYLFINCFTHGKFKQRASKHLEGSGCPDCAKTGFSVSKNATLYVLKADNITKVGITNLPVRVRLNAVSNDSGKTFEVVKLFDFKSGQACTDIETNLLRELRKSHRNPSVKFDGYTECFYDVDIDLLLHRVEELIGDYQ